MKRNGNISESGKMLILGIGILLILAIIVIVLVVRMKDDVRKRDAVVETLQQEIPEDGEGQAESGSETTDGGEAAGQENAADSETEDGSVQIGALEDEEDPQEQKAAENAGGIAVAKLREQKIRYQSQQTKPVSSPWGLMYPSIRETSTGRR